MPFFVHPETASKVAKLTPRKQRVIVLETIFDSPAFTTIFILWIYKPRPLSIISLSPTRVKWKPTKAMLAPPGFAMSHNANCQCLNQYPSALDNKDIVLQMGKISPYQIYQSSRQYRIWAADWLRLRDRSWSTKMVELWGTTSNPASGMWSLRFNTHWNNSKKLTLGLRPSRCSLARVALPATRIKFHGLLFSLQLATIHILLLYKAAPLAQKKRVLCLLFINFSHIYKHTQRVRRWLLNTKQHCRVCCYFSLSKFLWMRLKKAIFHQKVTNFWRCRSCLPCRLNL